MNCPHCGALLNKRPHARLFITGVLFLAAAVLLLLFVRMAVTVVAAVLFCVVGVSSLQAARRARRPRCRSCGKRS